MLKKNIFSIENIQPFAGYYDPTDNWNGWARPFFEWEVATQIVSWINEWSGEEQLKIDFANKKIIAFELEDQFDIEEIILATEYGIKPLYPVGAGWWIWDIHEKE